MSGKLKLLIEPSRVWTPDNRIWLEPPIELVRARSINSLSFKPFKIDSINSAEAQTWVQNRAELNEFGELETRVQNSSQA